MNKTIRRDERHNPPRANKTSQPSLSKPENYVRDAPSFRSSVASSYVLSYAISLTSLALLPLLPPQKDETQQLQVSRADHHGAFIRHDVRPAHHACLRSNGRLITHVCAQARAVYSNRYAVALVLMLGISLAYAVTVNILSTVPATSCLPIAGGEGCDTENLAAGVASGATALVQHDVL